MNFYDEILETIDECVNAGRLEEAHAILQRELGMPYIPAEAEEALHSREHRLRFLLNENREPKEWSLDKTLDRLLHGNATDQLAAAAKLADRNLRSCTAELQEYLSRDPLPEAAAILIDSLAEQQVNEEFTYRKDGTEYTFWADAVVPVSRSGGFRRAAGILEDCYAKDPVKAQMAKEVLINECYLFLPLSYDEDEAMVLADTVIAQIDEMMGDSTH